MRILDESIKYEHETINMRRHLHSHPELSSHEENTVKYVCDKLSEFGVKHHVVENGGVLGFIDGGHPGKTLLLRADMDALPIQENECNLNHRRKCISSIDGVMHACGHDGHTAMLLTAARILNEHRSSLAGKIILMFERGEELIMGAWKPMLNYLDECNIHIDEVCAEHVYADIDSNVIGLCDGMCMSSRVAFKVSLTGKGGHGSAPEKAVSPIDCYAYVYTELVERLKNIHDIRYSVGKVSAGTQRNIIPDKLIFEGTMRTLYDNNGTLFIETLDSTLKDICHDKGCSYEMELVGPSYAVNNNPRIAGKVRQFLIDNIGAAHVIQNQPWMASESWGELTHKYPGIMMFVGIRNIEKGTGALHHSDRFDIDEDSLKYGVCGYLAFVSSEMEM